MNDNNFILNNLKFTLIGKLIIKNGLRYYLGKVSKELKNNSLVFSLNERYIKTVNFDSNIVEVRYSVEQLNKFKSKILLRITSPTSERFNDFYIDDQVYSFNSHFYHYDKITKYIPDLELEYKMLKFDE